MKWHDTGKETEPDNKHPGEPVKSVPAYEAWVWENPQSIASIQRGIAQAEVGKLVTIDLAVYDDGEEDGDD